MFFDAMSRKNHAPTPSDMATIVPIHNAVNERAWSLIKTWEHRYSPPGNETCGGPRLRSFSGDAGRVSPKAWVRGCVGYERPFDRHDWVVERCEDGRVVEYVIDFYRGRGGGVSFYLDVRPKLNSWEGVRMRVRGLMGV